MNNIKYIKNKGLCFVSQIGNQSFIFCIKSLANPELWDFNLEVDTGNRKFWDIEIPFFLFSTLNINNIED